MVIINILLFMVIVDNMVNGLLDCFGYYKAIRDCCSNVKFEKDEKMFWTIFESKFEQNLNQNNKDCKTKVVEAPMASKKSKPGPQSSKNIISSLESKSGKSTESKTNGSSKTMTSKSSKPSSSLLKRATAQSELSKGTHTSLVPVLNSSKH